MFFSIEDNQTDIGRIELSLPTMAHNRCSTQKMRSAPNQNWANHGPMTAQGWLKPNSNFNRDRTGANPINRMTPKLSLISSLNWWGTYPIYNQTCDSRPKLKRLSKWTPLILGLMKLVKSFGGSCFGMTCMMTTMNILSRKRYLKIESKKIRGRKSYIFSYFARD